MLRLRWPRCSRLLSRLLAGRVLHGYQTYADRFLARQRDALLFGKFLAGLLTRLATLPLIGMALFIQTFVYPMSWADHLVWITLLGLLLARGPGAISIDALLARQFDAPVRAGA